METRVLISKGNESKPEKLSLQRGLAEDAMVSRLNRMVRKPLTNWNMGKVPYYLDTDSYDDIIEERIRKAMDTIEMSSCVVFEELLSRPETDQWLHITNPNKQRDCVHKLDQGLRGEMVLVIGYECMSSRDILHSLMHVLGFKDEVTHPQRDTYVRILWENIHPKYRHLFRLNTEELPYKTNVEYDTMSIMHFHIRAYSANGKATIAPLIPGLLFTPANTFSQLDIMKLGLAFGHECNKRKVDELIETCKKTLDPDDSTYDDYGPDKEKMGENNPDEDSPGEDNPDDDNQAEYSDEAETVPIIDKNE